MSRDVSVLASLVHHNANVSTAALVASPAFVFLRLFLNVPSLPAVEAQTLAIRRTVLQVHNVLLGVLHVLQHPAHHVHLPGEVPGRLLALHSQDRGHTAKDQDHHRLHLAGRRHQRGAGLGHGRSGGSSERGPGTQWMEGERSMDGEGGREGIYHG